MGTYSLNVIGRNNQTSIMNVDGLNKKWTKPRLKIQAEMVLACFFLFFLFSLLYFYHLHEGELQENRNLFIKNCVFILTCLTSVTFKILSLWCNTPIKIFFPLLKTIFELIDFDAFYCFWCFFFHLFHIGKMFPSEDFFIWGNKQKKSSTGWDQVNREGGSVGSCCFW